MPFQSKAQWRLCYAKKNRGEAGSWDCSEFAHATKSYKALPNKKQVKKAFFSVLGALAGFVSQQ